MLLSRDEFREQTKKRDGYRCVMCSCLDKEQGGNCDLFAHHVLERRLWSDGGYYLSNGTTLCEQHHIEAEQTILSCEEIREAAKITEIIIPEHLYSDNDFKYDKWGNIVLPNGTRLKGELFFDESVQKILTPVLHLFTDYIKYPRTFHTPWSNPSKDDRIINDISRFIGQEVVITEKLDGENSNLYSDFAHARSLSEISGEDHAYIKIIQSRIAGNIPQGWRICGENLYAQHSIKYENLETYFYVFSIWNERNECLSWDDTVEWSELLDLKTVPVLYRGIYDEEKIKQLWNESLKETREGYVIRITNLFSFADFRKCVMKFVRPSHVTTETHWRHKRIEPNKLKEGIKLW
jgi:hypothetical protein